MDTGDVPARRRLAVDLEDLAEAFENGFPDLHYYLDTETGEVAMVTDEIRRELEAIYKGLDGQDLHDPAVMAAAIHERNVADWEKDALREADRVEEGYGTRYIAVPRDDSREAYADMEDFIATVGDKRLRDRLGRAIEGRGAFGRFKGVLEDDDDERERWFAYRDARLRERIAAWLEDEGIEPA